MEGAKSCDCGTDNLKATELRLGLPGTEDAADSPTKGIKRSNDQEIEPVTKAQVVGWPPIRSYMKNNSFRAKVAIEADGVGKYVKVSMDGAPYLRKIDLKVYEGYSELVEGLKDLFKFFSLGCNDSDYAIAYEDKDGDWMLVGDVPWGMFINSCKRLRIMRGSEARGLDSNQWTLISQLDHHISSFPDK